MRALNVNVSIFGALLYRTSLSHLKVVFKGLCFLCLGALFSDTVYLFLPPVLVEEVIFSVASVCLSVRLLQNLYMRSRDLTHFITLDVFHLDNTFQNHCPPLILGLPNIELIRYFDILINTCTRTHYVCNKVTSGELDGP